MHELLKNSLKFFKNHTLYILCIIILGSIIFATQYQYWFGDYNRSDLESLKKQISKVEIDIDAITQKNEALIAEREKLNSGKEALEGAARLELGMIKPGETFYVFKDQIKEESQKDN